MKVKVSEINLTNIANSIREKLNVQTLYKPSEMSGAIDNITSHTEEAKENLKKFVDHTATTINVPEGTTKIWNYKFYQYADQYGTQVNCTLPSTITEIGVSSFYECKYMNIPNLPNSINKIGNNAFYKCYRATFATLPPNITSLEYNTFYECTRITISSIPSGIKTINSQAFYGCTSLTTMTFEGKPTTFSNTAFQNCTNLTTINVPWSSGAVAGAPWGATNATVVYNYTP